MCTVFQNEYTVLCIILIHNNYYYHCIIVFVGSLTSYGPYFNVMYIVFVIIMMRVIITGTRLHHCCLNIKLLMESTVVCVRQNTLCFRMNIEY